MNSWHALAAMTDSCLASGMSIFAILRIILLNAFLMSADSCYICLYLNLKRPLVQPSPGHSLERLLEIPLFHHSITLRVLDIFLRDSSVWCLPKNGLFSPLCASAIFWRCSSERCFPKFGLLSPLFASDIFRRDSSEKVLPLLCKYECSGPLMKMSSLAGLP